MAKTIEASQAEVTPEAPVPPTYLCFFCAVPLEKKTVFGKEVYQCPKCKRRVKPEDLENI